MSSLLANRVLSYSRFVFGNQLQSTFRQFSLSENILQRIKAAPILPIVRENNPLVEQKERMNIFENVNKLISNKLEGRLFAIVHLCGKQYKVTAGDIILVEGYWPPTIGDKIRLEKVLLAGGNEFTLIGSPILNSNQVDVQATIIEKTLTHTKTHFKKKRRKQYMRINFQRSPNTMIRINSISVNGNINEPTKDFSTKKIF